jgi:GT2 family glycosyltransferase
MTIAVLMTCFNRRELTLACLRRLFAQELPEDAKFFVTLVDDGSKDGTGEAVRAEFPQVEVLTGDGNLYWCGGMRRAWTHAAKQDPDYYLLLNDDTVLESTALAELLSITGAYTNHRIAIAAIRNPESGQISYGGVRLTGGKAPVEGTASMCDTFNANCVLVTRAVYEEIGMFHRVYTHAMGDTDYGFEARRHGIELIQSGRFLGSCKNNPATNTWRDRSLTRWQRLKALQSPKGLPFREWMEFNRRNAGWKWPYYTVSPILRILLGR